VVTEGIKPDTNYAVGATVQLLSHIDEYQHIRILAKFSSKFFISIKKNCINYQQNEDVNEKVAIILATFYI
jgi:hypothetical protein